jgi:hypothetical protein
MSDGTGLTQFATEIAKQLHLTSFEIGDTVTVRPRNP